MIDRLISRMESTAIIQYLDVQPLVCCFNTLDEPYDLEYRRGEHMSDARLVGCSSLGGKAKLSEKPQFNIPRCRIHAWKARAAVAQLHGCCAHGHPTAEMCAEMPVEKLLEMSPQCSAFDDTVPPDESYSEIVGPCCRRVSLGGRRAACLSPNGTVRYRWKRNSETRRGAPPV